MNVRLFWSKVNKSASNGCWEWMGHITSEGYGRVGVDGKNVLVHRFLFESVNGKIPDDLQLDHLCRNRRCCNPQHLEPVNSRENILRGEGYAAQNSRKTHCIHGHEFTEENTKYEMQNGHITRHCRKCHVNVNRKYRAKKYGEL